MDCCHGLRTDGADRTAIPDVPEVQDFLEIPDAWEILDFVEMPDFPKILDFPETQDSVDVHATLEFGDGEGRDSS